MISLIISAVCGLTQVAQGVQTFVAYLHFADVNDELREYDKLCGLLGGDHPEMSASLLDLWSPAPYETSDFQSTVAIQDKGEINLGISFLKITTHKLLVKQWKKSWVMLRMIDKKQLDKVRVVTSKLFEYSCTVHSFRCHCLVHTSKVFYSSESYHMQQFAPLFE